MHGCASGFKHPPMFPSFFFSRRPFPLSPDSLSHSPCPTPISPWPSPAVDTHRPLFSLRHLFFFLPLSLDFSPSHSFTLTYSPTTFSPTVTTSSPPLPAATYPTPTAGDLPSPPTKTLFPSTTTIPNPNPQIASFGLNWLL